MKFGGSSVADAGRLRGVASLVRQASGRAGVLVVLSALGGVTDRLIGAARSAAEGDVATGRAGLGAVIERHREVALGLFGEALPVAVGSAIESAASELGGILESLATHRELSLRSLDFFAGRGELLSTALLAAYLEVPWVDARLVLRTDSRHGEAKPQTREIGRLCAERLLPLVGPGMIAVTQGYIGADSAGVPTTLGRGGSDYSASLLGAALGAREIQIWTDVEGVLTCDPRIVPEARPVPLLGYDEAAELAAYGAKVLHPATILPAVELGIPVTVRNTLVPEGRFTTISRDSASGRPATALATRFPVTIVSVSTPRMLGGAGFLARIFGVFGNLGVSVDLLATSEISVSATVDADVDLVALERELSAIAEVKIERDRAAIALVGESLRRTGGVAARALTALGDINVEMISMGANEINLSLVVDAKNVREALRRLHRAFFEGPAAVAEGTTAVGGLEP